MPVTGVLLMNLGTPRSPGVPDVRRFLREFLRDPRVIDLPGPARLLLVELAILPFRPRRTAEAYRKIWTEAGSPLLANGRALRDAVAGELGPSHCVELAMRYGEPSLEGALERLLARGVSRIVAVPLYPQYAASSSGSALARLYQLCAGRWDVPPLRCVESFFDRPAFIEALRAVAAPALGGFRADHVVFSFHGLPERQIRRSDPTRTQCLSSATCCDAPGAARPRCYRAQCVATARALAAALGLPAERYTISFQSRLGRARWIEPHTDAVLPELAARGVKRLAVMCPSFVADCLETLEEIGIRARAQWQALGGDAFDLIPCPNAHPAFASALAALIRDHSLAA